jgi:opacity protein-like surface antigen
MKLRSALVAASAVLLPVAALAQPVDGLYIGAGAGYNYLQNQKVKDPSTDHALKGSSGVLGTASFGYGLGNGLRFEIQGDYRNTHQNGDGEKVFNQSYGAFANALFDFDVDMPVFPYVGVGVGYEWTNLKRGVLVDGTTFSGNKGSIAAQGIAGVSFPLEDIPGLSLTAEYRFMDMFEHNSYDGNPGKVKLGSEFSHSGIIGLRYALEVEAPPPPPAPAPAPVVAPTPPPARTYLVFFDWDKSDLTARAKQIIGEAAANVAKVKVTTIEVNGYTDLSGTAAYNQKLSVRRADSVAAELVKDGVPKAEIAIQGFGETHPLVPTAKGVREPQNRRVEIILK